MNQLESDQKVLEISACISSWVVLLFGIIFALLFITHPAAAVTTTTITAQDVSQYSISASQGCYIYEIIIDSLPIGTNQTHVLNSNGATFLLSIQSSQSWIIYNDFWVTMVYPNGTSETVHKTSVRISDGTYKTKIQPVFAQLQGITQGWKIDLNIGTNPTTVFFTSLGSYMDQYDVEKSIPFTSASGEFSGVTTTVYGYEIPQQQFADEITSYNPWGSLSNYAGQVFAWAWGMVTEFINRIPVIGPQFITVMTFIGIIGAEGIFWFIYIFTNLMLIIAGGEILLIMFAFLLAGKRPTPEKFVRNLVNYNIGSVKLFINGIGILYEWLRSFIETVAHIVNGLKPI